jgi:hypothetical protein
MGWPARRIVRTVIAAIMAAMTELRARRAAVSKRVWFPGWLMVVSTSRANVSSNAWTTWLLAGVIPSSWRMAALLVASWRGDWLVACRRRAVTWPLMRSSKWVLAWRRWAGVAWSLVTPAKNCIQGSIDMLGGARSDRLRLRGRLDASSRGRRGAAASPRAECTVQPGSTTVLRTRSAAIRRGTASPGQRKVMGEGVS